MKIIGFDEIIELKKLVSEKFGTTLHMHDACGGQSFSVDDTSKKLQAFVKKFFKEKNVEIVFTSDGKNFYVQRY